MIIQSKAPIDPVRLADVSGEKKKKMPLIFSLSPMLSLGDITGSY